MSQAIPVILDDGTNTKTLNPQSVDTGGTSTFRDSTVARELSESVSIGVTESARAQKVRVKRSVPIIKVIDGVDTVVGYHRVTIEEEFPISMAPADRAKETAKTSSLLSNQMIVDARNNGEAIWG